jgi:hypothetical protein
MKECLSIPFRRIQSISYCDLPPKSQVICIYWQKLIINRKSWSKSPANRFESCRQLSADQMNVPGFAGAFLFEADRRACSLRMRRTKMEVSVANGHSFDLSLPAKGSARSRRRRDNPSLFADKFSKRIKGS